MHISSQIHRKFIFHIVQQKNEQKSKVNID